MNDADARRILQRQFPALGLPAPTLAVLQGVQAVGRFEGFYGDASKPEGWAGSNNWGAIHCQHGPPCGEDCFEVTEHHADGSTYPACIKRYASPDDGAAALLHELWRRPSVRAALKTGDMHLVAQTMRNTGYHESPVGFYAKNLYKNARTIASSLGEALAVRPGGGGGGGLVEVLILGGGAWWLYRWARGGVRRAR